MVLYTLTTANIIEPWHGLLCGPNALWNGFNTEERTSPSLLSWRWPWNVSGFWPCQSLPGTPKAGSPSKPDFLTKVIQIAVYDCIRKCAQISNDFTVQPAQPAQPETPKVGSPSKISLLVKVIQTVVYDCIRTLSSETGWPPPPNVSPIFKV